MGPATPADSGRAGRRPLKQRDVDSLRAAEGERFVVWDAGARGLGVRVYATTASYILRVKPKGRPQILKTIGDARTMKLDDARREAERIRGEVAGGVAHGKAASVKALIDHFETTHRSRKKGRTPAEDRDSVRRCKLLRERWGTRPANEITHVDASALLAEITARGAKYEANRTRALVRTIWNLARRWGFVPASMLNPTDGTAANREQARDVRALKPAEVTKLLGAADKYPNPYPAAAIKLLALTGCRAGEVLALRWDDVDLREGLMVLRDRKGGDDLVLPLSDAARDVLERVPRLAGSPWVFPGRIHGEHIDDLRVPWAEILKTAALPAKTRVHDLRAAYATAIERSGGRKLAMLALGHADERTTARYVRPAQEDLRRAVNRHGRAVTGMKAKLRKVRAS